jgi:D-alanyl-D-alanine carboxypeptidase
VASVADEGFAPGRDVDPAYEIPLVPKAKRYDDDVAEAGSGPADVETAEAGSGPADVETAEAGSGPADAVAAEAGSGPADAVAAGAGSGPADARAAGAGSGPADAVAAGAGSGPADAVAAGAGSGPAGGDTQLDGLKGQGFLAAIIAQARLLGSRAAGLAKGLTGAASKPQDGGTAGAEDASDGNGSRDGGSEAEAGAEAAVSAHEAAASADGGQADEPVRLAPGPTDSGKKKTARLAVKKVDLKAAAEELPTYKGEEKESPPSEKELRRRQAREKKAEKAAKAAEKKAEKIRKAKERKAKAAEKKIKDAEKKLQEAEKKAALKAEAQAKKELDRENRKIAIKDGSAKKEKQAKKLAEKNEKSALKAQKAAAKKAIREEKKRNRLTKEEKEALKLEKQAAKHEKKIETFEKRAQAIEKKLERKAEKKAAVKEAKAGKKAGKKAVSRERRQIRKSRRADIKKQRKYWLKRGVGRAQRRLTIAASIVIVLGLIISGTSFAYRSDSINLPLLNRAVDSIAASPVGAFAKALDKPVHAALDLAYIPVSLIIKAIQGEPKFEDMYFYEADNTERYVAYKELHPNFSADEVVWRVNANADLMLYENAKAISDFSEKPLIINKFRSVPKNFKPVNLVRIPGTAMEADPETYEAFLNLQAAAAAEGLDISIASAFRPFEYQNVLYNPDIGDTRENLLTYMARPGFCEHQSGLALDVAAAGGRLTDFEGSPEQIWLHGNAEKFGFIIRYPKGAEDVTGARYEPWHIRYVGPELLGAMLENDIGTLEEYKVKFMDHKPGDTPEEPPESGAGTGAHGPI